ncbi:putative motility protein [Natronospora cellulosivora (SeqCode)]
MEISAISQQSLQSVQQHTGTAMLNKTMNQDAAAMMKLMEGVEELAKEIEQIVTPHRGSNIDVRV